MKLTAYANPVYTLSQSCTLVRVRTLLELCEDAVVGSLACDAFKTRDTPNIGDWQCFSESKADAVADARATLAKPFTRPTQQYDRAVATAVLNAWGDEFPAPTPVLSDLLAACKAATTERSIALRCEQTAIDAVTAYHADRVAAANAAYAAAFAALAEFESGKV